MPAAALFLGTFSARLRHFIRKRLPLALRPLWSLFFFFFSFLVQFFTINPTHDSDHMGESVSACLQETNTSILSAFAQLDMLALELKRSQFSVQSRENCTFLSFCFIIGTAHLI